MLVRGDRRSLCVLGDVTALLGPLGPSWGVVGCSQVFADVNSGGELPRTGLQGRVWVPRGCTGKCMLAAVPEAATLQSDGMIC